jgi:hypothetical protein
MGQRVVLLNRSTVSDSAAVTVGSGDANGGGIYAGGGLVSNYSTISNNIAPSAKALHSNGGGAFSPDYSKIKGSTISANSADRGGGLACAGFQADIEGSTISSNQAKETAGVFASTTMHVANSTIALNNSSVWTDSLAHQFAAGVYLSKSSSIDSSIVSNNVNSGAPSPTADITGRPTLPSPGVTTT